MKLSFSTSGWDLKFKDFVSAAKEYRFQGIEIHDVFNKTFTEEGVFSVGASASTIRNLREENLSIPCMDVCCNILDGKKSNVKETVNKIETAVNMGCPNLRLHAIKVKENDETEDERVIEFIKEVLPIAESKKINLLIETMGVYADTKRLQGVLDVFASDYLGALWDIHHTHTFSKESADDTIKNLGGYVKHVHVKDSKMEDGEVKYCLMGEGNLPIKDLFNALSSINYDGFYSLELQPKWVEDFGDMDIMFAQFVSYFSSFEKVPAWKNRLQENIRKTGKFIWEKDTLIDLTFPQVLDKLVKEFPDQLAFKYTTLEYTRTYLEFREDVDRFARALIALGVKAGDKVAVWATNIPEWYIAFWATTKIGAILVTVNTAYKIHEADYLLRQSDTHTLIFIKGYRDSDYESIVKELIPELENHKEGEPIHAKRLPFLRNVITVGFKMKGALTFEEATEFSKKVPLEEVNRRASLVSVHDVCNMQYTSGTTGFPKGVMLTHYNIVNNGKCIGDRMDLSTADRMMIQVPMFHCFGMVLSMTAAMTHSATISPLPYFSPKPALACINQEKITCFHGVPTMFIALLNHEDFAKTDFSYMRTGIMAGSPCPEPIMKEVLDKMNMKEITIVYGQTEASPGCTMSSIDDSITVRVSTVGRALPNIECKIVDPETGEDLPDNQIGEFVARGYNIMKGYYKMPTATAQAIDENGWLHTGDLALRMPDGNYKITGRLKDMIIRGGENIYPKEIEDFIYTHEKVKDVQVVGVSDKQYGEEIYAYVILNDGEEMTEDDLKAYVLAHMAKHKVPRYVEIVKSFPMNAAGKILKYKMREMAEERIKNLTK